MLYSEEAVRAAIRNREGKRVFFLGKGDQLTSAARDFLNRERIDIRPAEQAKIESYTLLSGGVLKEKPEHMTHLSGNILVPKDHPRIRFRGALDTLQAELLLAGQVAGAPAEGIGEVLDLARRIVRCEVLEEPLEPGKLLGMTEEEIHRRSHFPQEYYGQPHFMPSFSDGPVVLRLNRSRCAAREAELAAVTAFQDREGNPTRPDILMALNRMSSVLYLLMIRHKSRAGG